jgi:SNF2 family DNA or RNA helicase
MNTVPAELEADGNVWLTTSWVHKDLVRTIPGASWDKKREQWHMPISWSGCLALRGTFREALEIGPSLTEWAVREKTERIDPCLALRDVSDWPAGDPKLFWWQRSGAEFIARAKRCLIADDPGAGKTATAIRGLAQLSAQGENIFPILVVCPNSMKKTWEREFETWWPGIECSVVKGGAAQRRKAFQVPAHVYIINWEGLRSHSRLAPFGSIELKKCMDHGGLDPKVTENACHVHPRELNSFKFGAVIADEVHRAKDPSSQQTRALWAASGDAPVRIALTGTPIANDVTDLWPILHWINPKEWPTKTRWINRFIDTMLNAFGALMVLGIKPGMYQEFYDTLNPVMRRMPEDVVLKHLPPFIWETRECEMSAKQAKAYKQMAEEMIAEVEGGSIIVDSPLTKTTRLLQLASSYADVEKIETTDEHGRPIVKTKVTLADPSSKLDAFMDDLPDFSQESVAVMAVSRQLIELLSARLDKKKIPHGLVTGRQSEDERQQHMDDFQEGKTQFILFTAGAGGTGITLTAARYLCRLQRPYSLVDDKQTVRRVRRIGSERHPNIIVRDYLTEGTVDSKVIEALDKKGVNFEEVVRDKDAFIKMLRGEE